MLIAVPCVYGIAASITYFIVCIQLLVNGTLHPCEHRHIQI